MKNLSKLHLSRPTFNELMFEAQRQGITLTGVIVFKSSNWPDQDYSLESRSYQVSNQSNYYSWEIEYCYLTSDEAEPKE